ncbi:uncharacterized protein [Clytia hemisphaerica]|uniref:PH domain-containing protein n=1 Tax=Clytia hemisphaerica TaxID=252671 RepID=A0A7M5UMT8_9CNID
MSNDTINGIITDDDVIHSGWLTKSPPQKKMKNAASWTIRYFRLCYFTKESFDRVKAICTKIDPAGESKDEADKEAADQSPNRLCLVFWKNESANEKPLRAISLRDSSIRRLEAHPDQSLDKKFPNMITLVTPSRKYFFSDRNPDSANKWLEMIGEAIKYNNDGELSVQ